MKSRRPSRADAAKWAASLDLFGEVPVTRQDVYAWLLAVVQMDPASERAFTYVRMYGVLNKIVRAKLDGTFDQIIAPARHSARFREVAQTKAVEHASNELGLGDWEKAQKFELATKRLRAPRRAKEVIAKELAEDAARKRARKAVDSTMLRRLPRTLPSLAQMLDDIGSPSPEALAGAFDVAPATATRWIRDDAAPLAVRLALFWLTKWGASVIDANAHNDTVAAVTRARSLEEELARINTKLHQVGRIADFGSANDPVPELRERLSVDPSRVPGMSEPGATGRTEIPIVVTSLRSAPCAESARKKKSA